MIVPHRNRQFQLPDSQPSADYRRGYFAAVAEIARGLHEVASVADIERWTFHVLQWSAADDDSAPPNIEVRP